jgi:hypothetical protein
MNSVQFLINHRLKEIRRGRFTDLPRLIQWYNWSIHDTVICTSDNDIEIMEYYIYGKGYTIFKKSWI